MTVTNEFVAVQSTFRDELRKRVQSLPSRATSSSWAPETHKRFLKFFRQIQDSVIFYQEKLQDSLFVPVVLDCAERLLLRQENTVAHDLFQTVRYVVRKRFIWRENGGVAMSSVIPDPLSPSTGFSYAITRGIMLMAPVPGSKAPPYPPGLLFPRAHTPPLHGFLVFSAPGPVACMQYSSSHS